MHTEYLQAYCDINDIEVTEDFVKAGKLLKEQPNKEILNLARKGYILEAFKKYLREEIDVEMFMQVGDVESQYEIYVSDVLREAHAYVETKLQLAPETFTDTVVLLEETSVLQEKKAVLQKQVQAKGGEVFFI